MNTQGGSVFKPDDHKSSSWSEVIIVYTYPCEVESREGAKLGHVAQAEAVYVCHQGVFVTIRERRMAPLMLHRDKKLSDNWMSFGFYVKSYSIQVYQ